jgi:hypothetical protein
MHRLSRLSLLCVLGVFPLVAQRIPHPDHHEFEATLSAPFLGEVDEARTFRLLFRFPDAEELMLASWRLELTDAKGRLLRQWHGETFLSANGAVQALPWDGLDQQGAPMAPGHYRVRLTAHAMSDQEYGRSTRANQIDRVEHHLTAAPGGAEVQTFDIQVGHPERPALLPFQPLPTQAARAQAQARVGAVEMSAVAATSGLPYTIYLGNLHSQTNHSDGGGAVTTCTSAQSPQTGGYGPADAFAYAQAAGLDVLMASEHNHMFDGSTGTNAAANPATAKALFASGLTAASSFNSTHPGFLALYGMEWGVITNGGHLNILNPDGLANWELNASGQLIGDYNTPKGDYAGLYTFMKSKGWVGQFNHPSTSTQFNAAGADLGFTADGDTVMALCEVLNTSAFSVNTSETETSRSSFESAWNILLERGYHVAPSTDQDNHCANWGRSFTNRTAVLIPNGTALSLSSYLDAVRARRVFATMDKGSQIILTANGHLMGERFVNSGALTFAVNYASTSGQTVAKVETYEGVPGRNGAVSLLSSTATTTTTPTVGNHFYYAKITQGNGNLLWSAPVWVTQQTGMVTDTTAPTVTASETGTSGLITLSATASDNVGVARVEFYVDAILQGTASAAPYGLSLDSRTLANGSHSLMAKAYDAAGNIGTSTATAFAISNTTTDTSAPTATVAEAGTSGLISFTATATDNVGVTKVEFYVDGLLKGTLAAAPYKLTLDSTPLSNGSHSVTVKAYDAAGNVGTSSAVAFSVSNVVVGTTFNELEPNDTLATANTVPDMAVKVVGYFKSTSDNDDWFKVNLLAGHTLVVDMVGPTASAQDYDLYLLSSTGTQLASSAGTGTTEHLSYKNTNASAAKVLYIKVHRYASYSSVTPYTLSISR